jgi:hypothetical protein
VVPADRQRVLVLALLASLLVWNLPFGGLVMYPFKLFATWLHELAHGIVMLVTGAGFSHLEIYRDTSGIAFAVRGVGALGRAAIASAGYMGASMAGAGLLVLGQSRRGARSILAGLGALLAVTALVWVDNDFGVTATLIGAGACLLAALLASERIAVFLVNFLAAQACVNAVLDIRVLFRSQLVINGASVGASDAHNMADATFGNHTLWAAVWLAFAFASFFLALRRVEQRQRETTATTAAESA